MRNSTAAHTGWLLLLLLAITATTIWLFAGAQWDQSSIFRPTVQFLSVFVIFCRFLTIFWYFLVVFCQFLAIFGDFWQFLVILDNFWWLIIHIMRGWPNKKGRALALKQELCLLVCPKSGTCEKFAAQSGVALVHDFPNIEFFFCTPSGGPLALGKEGK